jgi:hypothetical protein
MQQRSLLLHGLGLTLRRFPALLWAFAFNLFFAALTTARIASAIGRVTDTSLASRPLAHGFDLGTFVSLLGIKLAEGPGLNPSIGTSVILYLATYFLLVPGTLLCYQTGAPAKLSTLLHTGITHFWRFVRIALLSGLVFGIVLGPLAALQSKWADHVDDHTVGLHAFVAQMTGVVLIALVAAVLRLYFDLVEVYTVQLGCSLGPSGKPDRRVRKTLLPALRALRANFRRAYLSFLFLTVLGIAAVALAALTTMHSLAQSHIWPMFFHVQLGLFLMLLTRFWQRGAETTLALDNPINPKPTVRTTFVPREPSPPVSDPIPNPEPATPSLPSPDPGIFPHEPPIASPS